MTEYFEFENCRLAYRIDGPRSAPPLIMLQGVGAHGITPNPFIEILSRTYCCLGFDNRGIGESQPAGRPVTLQQMASDALALMSHVGWESAHMVGHSFGGMVALEMALRERPRARSLSLLCTFARGSESLRPSARLLWIVLRLKFAPRAMRERAFLDLVLPRGYPAHLHKEVTAKLASILGHEVADVPPIAREQVNAMRAADVVPRLGELSGMPTLVINAEDDLIARPVLGKAIAKEIGGAQYIGIPGAGHSFPILEPKRCAALVLAHLATAEQGWAGHYPESHQPLNRS